MRLQPLDDGESASNMGARPESGRGSTRWHDLNAMCKTLLLFAALCALIIILLVLWC